LGVRYHGGVSPKDAARNKKSAQLQRLRYLLACFHDDEVHRSRIPITSKGSDIGALDLIDKAVRESLPEAD